MIIYLQSDQSCVQCGCIQHRTNAYASKQKGLNQKNNKRIYRNSSKHPNHIRAVVQLCTRLYLCMYQATSLYQAISLYVLGYIFICTRLYLCMYQAISLYVLGYIFVCTLYVYLCMYWAISLYVLGIYTYTHET